MNKLMTTVPALAVAAVLALGSTAAMSAAPATGSNPYNVPPGGVLKLDKSPTKEQTAMICNNLAKSKSLKGSELTSYLASCKSGG